MALSKTNLSASNTGLTAGGDTVYITALGASHPASAVAYFAESLTIDANNERIVIPGPLDNDAGQILVAKPRTGTCTIVANTATAAFTASLIDSTLIVASDGNAIVYHITNASTQKSHGSYTKVSLTLVEKLN